jgi:1,4-alpha-glucan branching enzyme
LEYLRPYLPAAPHRSFTGVKYWAITGGATKQLYDPAQASARAATHAAHFLAERTQQFAAMEETSQRTPILCAPYDAELFGHWWFEGPEFLDHVVRGACAPGSGLRLETPSGVLRDAAAVVPGQVFPSSWGEGGYWKVWLNEGNEWMHRRVRAAQARLSDVARRVQSTDPLQRRALAQAARELLLAQASDWAFLVRAGTSAAYARHRFRLHLERLDYLLGQLDSGSVCGDTLAALERATPIFPDLASVRWD